MFAAPRKPERQSRQGQKPARQSIRFFWIETRSYGSEKEYLGAGSCHGTLLNAYWQDSAQAAGTGRKVEATAERLAQAAGTGRKAGPLVERLAPAVVPRLQAPQVSVDPPAEPQLRPSGFWAEFFGLLAKSIALFDL